MSREISEPCFLTVVNSVSTSVLIELKEPSLPSLRPDPSVAVSSTDSVPSELAFIAPP